MAPPVNPRALFPGVATTVLRGRLREAPCAASHRSAGRPATARRRSDGRRAKVRRRWLAAAMIAFFEGGTALAQTPEVEALYRQGQAAFHRKDYGGALSALGTYVARGPKKDPRRFDVIQQIARIHLQVQHDPDRAIAFLVAVRKESGLADEQRDDLEAWLATARDWKKLGKMPASVKDADELFALAEKFYRAGTTDTNGVADETGAAARAVAASYLVPFVANFDGDARIQQALIMLGDIRRRAWTEEDYWTENFYLKESIRRFPHTPGARKAYRMLEDDVHVRWSGSSGDHTPPGLLQMLARYKRLAAPARGAEETHPRALSTPP